MKTWKCTVCGYIHEGDAPPEFCPVCNWGSDKFIQIANYKRKLLLPQIKSKMKSKKTGNQGHITMISCFLVNNTFL